MKLSSEEFRRRVLGRRPSDLSLDIVETLISQYLRNDWTDDSAIQRCLDDARLFEDRLSAAQAKSSTMRPMESAPNPGEVVISERLLEMMRPRVEEVRQALFGNPAPPFPSSEAAIQWLVHAGEEEWKRQRDKTRQVLEGFLKQVSKLPKPIRAVDWQAPFGRRIKPQVELAFGISYTQREIPYKTSRADLIPAHEQLVWQSLGQDYPHLFPKGAERHWAITLWDGSSPLAELEQVAHDLAQATGFDKLDIVAYILADVKPILPPMLMRVEQNRFKLADGSHLVRTPVTIEISHPEQLTYAQFWEMYRWIRQTFQMTRVKALTSEGQRLLDLVKQLGGVPKKGKTVFWERVRQAWNEEKGYEAYGTWRGLAMRYQRLMKKLVTSQSLVPDDDKPSGVG